MCIDRLQTFFRSMAKNENKHLEYMPSREETLLCFESKTPTCAYYKTFELCAAFSSKISSWLFPRTVINLFEWLEKVFSVISLHYLAN